MSDEKLKNVIIGGMLHDIGKLLQRAQQDYSKTHSEIGYDFFIKQKIKISGIEEIADCIRYHHADSIKKCGISPGHVAYIVYEADNIAAGMDRRKRDDYEKSKGFDKELPLHSVFARINENRNNYGEYGYHLRDLKEDNPINYPIQLNDKNIKAIKSGYEKIKQVFIDGIHNNWEKIETGTANSILQILEATTGFIPSSTNKEENPDISLYDHMKLTSAIGSCLYLYCRDVLQAEDFKKCFFTGPNRKENYFRLISADLSGIQDFIYDVPSEGALKSLRARSFYLDLLMEHIGDEILESMELSRANLLYTGGGHFYMLLPNTPKTELIINEAREKTNRWFYEMFGTLLYLAIADLPCSSDDLMDTEKHGSVSQLFKNLALELSNQKLRRYSFEQLKEITESITKNQNRECRSCKHSTGRIREGEDLCSFCLAIKETGRALMIEKLEAIRILSIKPESKDCLPLPSFYEKPRYLDLKPIRDINNSAPDYHRVYIKNRWSEGYGVATVLWIADYLKEGLSEFNQLVKSSAERGIERLAVLRADVDGLGAVFTGGFRREEAGQTIHKYETISRYAALSRQLSLFFKHHITKICEGKISGAGDTENKHKNFRLDDSVIENNEKSLAVVYSGGDDIFVAGAWEDVINFAVDLRNAFREFTCNKLTFSAGIGFFSPHFPISQMAKLTEELEKAAKNNSDKKDSVALFGKDRSIETKDSKPAFNDVYSWNEFNSGVHPKIKAFLETFRITDSDRDKLDISKAFLYRLLNLLKVSKKKKDDGSCSINLARLAYALARLDNPGASEEKKAKIKTIKEQIYLWATQGEEKRQLITAVNLLIYMFRESVGNKK